MTRNLLAVALISVVAGAVSVVMHTCLTGLLHVEARLFLLIAAVVAPLGLVVGVVGAAVCALVTWKRRAREAAGRQP